MNNVSESKFLHKLGRFIARPITSFNFKKSKTPGFSIENSPVDFEAIAMAKDAINEATITQKTTRNFDELPKDILAIAPFKDFVKEELTNGNQSFLLKFSLNKENCSFLSAEQQKDLGLDGLKLLQKATLGAKSLAFSPSGDFWLLLANKTEQSAITKANVAFKIVQKLFREELDVHQSLVELNMYKIQDCLPEIA